MCGKVIAKIQQLMIAMNHIYSESANGFLQFPFPQITYRW